MTIKKFKMDNYMMIFCPVERIITKFKKLNGDYLCLSCNYKCGENRFNELTAKQEDDMLEAGRERDYEKKFGYEGC